jgi:hypothetical protein
VPFGRWPGLGTRQKKNQNFHKLQWGGPPVSCGLKNGQLNNIFVIFEIRTTFFVSFLDAILETNRQGLPGERARSGRAM